MSSSLIELGRACPSTGYIKSSCGCVRCKNARAHNRYITRLLRRQARKAAKSKVVVS